MESILQFPNKACRAPLQYPLSTRTFGVDLRSGPQNIVIELYRDRLSLLSYSWVHSKAGALHRAASQPLSIKLVKF